MRAHVEGCERAAAEGAKVLAAGGSALDAVQRAVEVLESDPLFNAGTGACLDADGHLALDASIMDGTDLRAGAVCALPAFEHPIAIARRVMEATPHVLLAGDGASRFAVAQGFVPADEASMITDAARKKWEAARAKGTTESWAGGRAVDERRHGRRGRARRERPRRRRDEHGRHGEQARRDASATRRSSVPATTPTTRRARARRPGTARR